MNNNSPSNTSFNQGLSNPADQQGGQAAQASGAVPQVIQYDPAMAAWVHEAGNPIRQNFIHQLLGLAYSNTAVDKTFEPYHASQLEKAYFLKYNYPDIPTTPETTLTQPRKLTHIKYIRATPVFQEPVSTQGKMSLYPRFSTELNFYPQLNYFQRFTQNVYTRPGETKTEEKEITVKTTGNVQPSDLGFKTPQSIENFSIFKIQIVKEAFNR